MTSSSSLAPLCRVCGEHATSAWMGTFYCIGHLPPTALDTLRLARLTEPTNA